MFKTETRYALHAATVLARAKGLVANAELAVKLDISLPMVAKILNRLVQAGLVTSRRGPGGGYTLSRPAAEIHLREVVAPTEGDQWGSGCLMGLSHCDDTNPCALHPAWLKLRTRILSMLDEHTVREMADGTVDVELRVEGTHDFPQA
ncbi:Rrf2 family transcriptional regulator [bacterium]|nr:Rrf2 family transcriptional regulator [bacterium]